MQRKNQEQKKQRTSLSSKLREFWILHPNILILAVCVVFGAIAVGILCAVSLHNHWNLKAIFASPTAILIYVLVGFATVVYVFQRFIFKRW